MGTRETYAGVDKMNIMTDEREVVQKQLSEWITKYCPENRSTSYNLVHSCLRDEFTYIMFVNYHKHDVHNYEGWTRYVKMSNSGRRYADIYMKPLYKNRPTLRKIVLWHEFCHAWCWCSIGATGHGWEFFKRIIQKPQLFLGQVVVAFVVPFLKG